MKIKIVINLSICLKGLTIAQWLEQQHDSGWFYIHRQSLQTIYFALVFSQTFLLRVSFLLKRQDKENVSCAMLGDVASSELNPRCLDTIVHLTMMTTDIIVSTFDIYLQ